MGTYTYTHTGTHTSLPSNLEPVGKASLLHRAPHRVQKGEMTFCTLGAEMVALAEGAGRAVEAVGGSDRLPPAPHLACRSSETAPTPKASLSLFSSPRACSSLGRAHVKGLWILPGLFSGEVTGGPGRTKGPLLGHGRVLASFLCVRVRMFWGRVAPRPASQPGSTKPPSSGKGKLGLCLWRVPGLVGTTLGL